MSANADADSTLAPSADVEQPNTSNGEAEPAATTTTVTGAGTSPDDAVSDDDEARKGTIWSARFNILSTMVGGGCLSLPLAFQQSGNALLGPILLIVITLITDFCFRLLVESSKAHSGVDHNRRGTDSFESLTSAAFGPSAFLFSMALVTSMCFFGTVGYCVLLRDMLKPITDSVHVFEGWDWLHKNLCMFVVVLGVTPLCTLKTFTALQSCNATSMLSILILGSSIVFRSIQCNIASATGSSDSDLFEQFATATANSGPWYSHLRPFPDSAKEVLDALPLFISCYVCHYNIPSVHNELREPSPIRVSWWLRSTAWTAFALYMVLGVAGSMYGNCTETGKVQGNVLLDFDEDDPLLLVGRMCLALTITLAFPMLIIPARDIVIRFMMDSSDDADADGNDRTPNVTSGPATSASPSLLEGQEALEEPLLQALDPPSHSPADSSNDVAISTDDDAPVAASAPITTRLAVAVAIFWTAAAFASSVQSIDTVWDLLGSSLSILLSYLLPCGIYLQLTKDQEGGDHANSRILAWVIIVVFTPLMFISTGNAVYNTATGQ